MKRLLGLLALFAAGLVAQTVQQVLPNPDCQIFFSLTATGQNSGVIDNRQQGCTSWNMSYTNSGFSAVTLTLQTAANNAGVPGSYGTGFPVQQTVVAGSNPSTSTTAGFLWVQGINAFARMHLVATGSGIVQGAIFGWRIPNADAQGGTPGAITCLTGDVTAGSGSGCVTATVVGLESVPFCSGYTPTTGQFVQYTTGSSPNPCYTAAAASSTTGNAASIVTYTPGASVTLTCPSVTAGTVTVFAPGNAVPASYTALAANMTITFAACKSGQDVVLAVKQAASGGPYTVTGLPTGSPQISSFASAVTTYILHATAATTVAFDNVSADSGPGVCTEIAAPGTPPSAIVYFWCDSTGANLQAKNPAGAISGTAYAKTAAANQPLLSFDPTTGLFTQGAVSGAPSGAAGGDLGGTYPNPTVTNGSHITNASIPNSGLVNASTTVNGQTCTLGSTCTVTAVATAVPWNAITAPTGNLSLTMAANTSTWTYNATTGSADLWVQTDTTNNTGTGYLVRHDTASGSTLKPFHVGAAGVDAISTNASGQVGINTATPALGMLLVASTVNTTPRGISSGQWSTDTASARFNGYKARGTQTSQTTVVTGDFMSRWSGFAYDGSNFLECASVVMSVQGTVASTRTPGQIDFQTCTDAAPSVLTTAMTINKAQVVNFVNAPTLATMTSGSVLFAGTSGVVSQDNTNLFYDSTNKAILVSGFLQVGPTNASNGAGTGYFTNITVNSSTAGAGMVGYQDSGSAVTSGTRIGYLALGGATDSSHTLQRPVVISGFAAETWSGSATGAYITFLTTATGGTTRTEKMRLWGSGGVSIGNTTDPGAGNLSVTGQSRSAGFVSQGTTFTASGCSVGTLVGGATAGKMTSGTTGTCTITITLPTSPGTGWTCAPQDRTTLLVGGVNPMTQSADSTTSCTITGTTASGDIISFSAIGY